MFARAQKQVGLTGTEPTLIWTWPLQHLGEVSEPLVTSQRAAFNVIFEKVERWNKVQQIRTFTNRILKFSFHFFVHLYFLFFISLCFLVLGRFHGKAIMFIRLMSQTCVSKSSDPPLRCCQDSHVDTGCAEEAKQRWAALAFEPSAGLCGCCKIIC